MSPLNPLFSIAVYLIAFLTAFLISRKLKVTTVPGRYESIEGLRGLLALGVFIHHTVVWYFLLKKDVWELPDSNFIVQLGDASVVFFFMITSFLFVSKLLNTGKFNWKSFFISRIFRIAPMYFFIILLVVLICFAAQDFLLIQNVSQLTSSIAQWLSFTILGMDNINDFEMTKIVTAGVTWTLPYEWLFYFSLPLISLFLLKGLHLIYIVISVVFIIFYFQFNIADFNYLAAFLGGAIAPFIIKYSKVKINFNNLYFTIILIICFLLIPLFSMDYSYYCKILLSFIFTLIAMGNDLFGFFKIRFLKFLGEVSYSTYLIHGILLFVCFYFIVGFENAKKLNEAQYMITIFAITPVVVILSFVCYKFIEKPFMDISYRIRKK